MGIIYQKDKRSGITYAYENTAYWDKELKKSRSKRTLIGRVDPETGEIRKTDGRGLKRDATLPQTLKGCKDELRQLRKENNDLKVRITELESMLAKFQEN